MVFSKEEGATSTKLLEMLILEFLDSGKVGGVSNEIFLLVITVTMPNYDVPRILVNEKVLVTSCMQSFLKNLG